MSDPQNLEDVVNINLEFENGSVGTISYFANGAKSVAKEYVEVHRAGVSGILKDFKELEVHGAGKVIKKRLVNQDKGQAVMVRSFLKSVENGGESPISMREICAVTRTTFRAVESLRTHKVMEV